MQNNLSEKVLKMIKKDKIKPKPRWEFLLKNYVIWLAGFMALLIGGLATAVIIHMFKNNDWDVYKYINDSLAGFIFVTLPYFWLVFLGIFIFVIYYNFKHTRTGYRYQLSTLVVAVIFISVILGSLFYQLGLGRAVDDVLGDKLPLYRQFLNQRQKIWRQPERGLLAGVVTAINAPNDFYLRDFGGQQWYVFGREADIFGPVMIAPGNSLKIVGDIVGEMEFRAEIIGPFIRPLPEFNFMPGLRTHFSPLPLPQP